MTDHALDALLAEYATPPPPADLAGRAIAAALALPQEPRPAQARRDAGPPRRDRRGGWLRRPLLAGGVALGLAVSGAVAANLAGVKLDGLPLVEAVLARLSFIDRTPAEPSAPPAPAAPPALAPLPEPPLVVAPQASREAPGAPPKAAEPRAPDEEAPAMPAPEPMRVRDEISLPPRVEIVAPSPAAPAPVIREERSAPVTAPELRLPPPAADDRLRSQRVQRERIEWLRAARQAQIERTQRLQERRERMRRLRRD